MVSADRAEVMMDDRSAELLEVKYFFFGPKVTTDLLGK
jgi:hypothetical protein